MNDELLVRFIVERFEGHDFTDDPVDSGGPTRFGITLDTLASYRHRPVSVEEVVRLTKGEALLILVDRYVRQPGFAPIVDPRLKLAVVDYGVNSGARRAAVALQTALKVPVDGFVGPVTRQALSEADSGRLREAIIAHRLRHLGRLITVKPDQSRFAQGWMDRVATVLEWDAPA